MELSARILRSEYVPILPLGMLSCRVLVGLALVLIGTVFVSPALAIDWDGNGGSPPNGTYSDANNWNPDQVPTTDDTATFNVNDNYIVTFDAEPDAIGQLDVSAGGAIFASGITRTLAVNTAGGSQDVTINGSSSLTLGLGTVAFNLIVGGDLTVEDSATLNVNSGSKLTANGDIIIDGANLSILAPPVGPPPGLFSLAAGKTVTIQNGGHFSLSSHTTAANANYEVTGSGSSLTTSTLSITSGAAVNVEAMGSLQTGTTSLNIGLGSTSIGTLTVDGSGTMVTGGSGSGSNWGGSGGQAFVTFSNGAEATIGNLNLAMGATAGTSAMLDVLSGAVLNTGRMFIVNSGGSTTSATINVQGNGSSVNQSGGQGIILGHASTGSAVINVGTTESGASFTSNAGSVTVNATGTVSIGSATTTGTFDVHGPLTVNGTVNLTGGTMYARDELKIDSSGNFSFTGGTLHADLIVGDLLNGGGTLEPGFSIASLLFDGDYTQAADGKLLIELGETSSSYDRLEAGTITLDGALEVVLGSYAPQLDDEFEIISSYLEIIGEFGEESLQLPELEAGLDWSLFYDTTTVTLTVVEAAAELIGDYSGDGKVSAADFTVWRDNFGSATLTNRDPDNSGPVDADDFESWKEHYGEGDFGGGAGIALSLAVPEPAAWLLAVGPVFFCLTIRKTVGDLLVSKQNA